MKQQQAEEFAEDWIAAWNARDLERILAHYEDDFEMNSPVIVSFGEPSGMLKGKEAVGRYWSAALAKYPELHFELRHVLTGVSSVALIYDGVRGLSNEVFHFAKSGKVARAFAHYLL
ncbi:nuclear transport factor 2 family protein [Proteobacteria bacterium 005FR1]|nr:nuclear transport factor 2 family protein [Proteobacteria bacterium 005FR1]